MKAESLESKKKNFVMINPVVYNVFSKAEIDYRARYVLCSIYVRVSMVMANHDSLLTQ